MHQNTFFSFFIGIVSRFFDRNFIVSNCMGSKHEFGMDVAVVTMFHLHARTLMRFRGALCSLSPSFVFGLKCYEPRWQRASSSPCSRGLSCWSWSPQTRSLRARTEDPVRPRLPASSRRPRTAAPQTAQRGPPSAATRSRTFFHFFTVVLLASTSHHVCSIFL